MENLGLRQSHIYMGGIWLYNLIETALIFYLFINSYDLRLRGDLPLL